MKKTVNHKKTLQLLFDYLPFCKDKDQKHLILQEIQQTYQHILMAQKLKNSLSTITTVLTIKSKI